MSLHVAFEVVILQTVSRTKIVLVVVKMVHRLSIPLLTHSLLVSTRITKTSSSSIVEGQVGVSGVYN